MIVALYPGSFDPLTPGHAAVVRQAARLFDHVRVLIADNPTKSPALSTAERLEAARDALGTLPNVSVDCTSGLVVEYARSIGAACLLRGIRDADDAAVEARMAAANRRLAPELPTLLLGAASTHAHISSSALKRMLTDGEDVSDWVSPALAARLRSRLGEAS
ncbi:MAG: pantetheine-phosphate adenylyltransferase [Deltaproteobacteria bacterium]|nr:pantetheine-phosphate adenylyltransferase [Deltaproteobacteria bacterium]